MADKKNALAGSALANEAPDDKAAGAAGGTAAGADKPETEAVRNTRKTSSVFETLSKIDVSGHVDKKEGGKDKYGKTIYLSYLSWPWAWATVKSRYPDADYSIYMDDMHRPYVNDPVFGLMVFTTVTIQRETHEMWLPVMDSTNNALKDKPYTRQYKNYTKEFPEATMCDINKAIMRCLVKNLAMFGLGLNLYAGEDLPVGADTETAASTQAKQPAKQRLQASQQLQPAQPAGGAATDARRPYDPKPTIKFICDKLGMDPVGFAGLRQSLIDQGKLPDIPSAKMTEQDWKKMFTVMWESYPQLPAPPELVSGAGSGAANTASNTAVNGNGAAGSVAPAAAS